MKIFPWSYILLEFQMYQHRPKHAYEIHREMYMNTSGIVWLNAVSTVCLVICFVLSIVTNDHKLFDSFSGLFS